MNRLDLIEKLEAMKVSLLRKLVYPTCFYRDMVRGKLIATNDLLSIVKLKIEDEHLTDKEVKEKLQHLLFHEDIANQINKRNERIIISAIKENERLQKWFEEQTNYSG